MVERLVRLRPLLVLTFRLLPSGMPAAMWVTLRLIVEIGLPGCVAVARHGRR